MEQKVLVVEDDQEINELIGEYLSLEHFAAARALDGKTGLEKAQAEHPDAAVLDLMLPDVDGYEVCRQLSSHRATANIPVIILTCMNQDCDRLKGYESGAFRYLNKPFLPDDLINQVKAAFEWKRHLPERVPQGQIEIYPAEPEKTFQGVNEMMADFFAHSDLSDAAIGSIREGFRVFQEWAGQWAKQNQRDMRLYIEYRLNLASGEAAQAAPADSVEWTIWERQPGLLAATLFKALPSPAVLTSNKLNGQLEATGSPLTSWYQFLAKAGVGRIEKDAAHGQIRLHRQLRVETGAPAAPLLTFDGGRLPTRLRAEAVTSKHR